MSGFEVAGLVLGVLPLAIKTINFYRTALSSSKSAQHDLNWLRIDLETEHIRLQNTCEILLHDLVPFSLVDVMIKDPFGADWAKYNDKLRERLWRSWTIFQAQVQVLSAAVVELENKLYVERNGSIKLSNHEKIMREIKQKASFTIKKQDYETLLSKIKSSNTILEGLTKQDNALKLNRRRRSQARVIKLFRRVSESIFHAMCCSITCDCANSHIIGIELITRQAVLLPDDDEDQVVASFDHSVVVNSVKAAAGWNRAILQTGRVTNQAMLVRVPSRVTWRPSIPDLPQETAAPPGNHQPLEPRTCPLIPNLCRVFHGQQQTLYANECYGHISGREHRFHVLPPPDEPSTFSYTNTLRDILSGSKGFSGSTSVSFGYEERLQLALTLSNSILHTYNTPWLRNIVTLDDIVVFLEGEAQLHPDWWKSPFQPFVTRAIPLPMSDPSLRIINTTILSLGALLIQIITGSVEESLDIPPIMSLEEVNARRLSASRLESKVIENGGPNYAKAVTWCFDHAIGLSGFQHEQFCQEFYELVILRLEEDAALLDEQSRL